MKVVIGSRSSSLAIAQSEEVKQALLKIDPSLDVIIKTISTKGDQILDKPLNQIGDKGLFTSEIERQLLDESIDIAVHSMKDMPSTLMEGLQFAGTIDAQDPFDCLVFNHNYKSLDDIPYGGIVATGSLRRKYQLLKLRNDLKIVNIRGNVLTRLKKMKDNHYDAIVLASAGLKRLNMDDRIGYVFSLDEMIPACCQGILAIEAKQDSILLPLLNQIVDEKTTIRMNLERLFLETLNVGCHSPSGVHVELKDNSIIVHAVYGHEDGKNLKVIHQEIFEDYECNLKEIALNLKE